VACYKPLTAWKPLDGGSVIFQEKRNHREITLPCGQCIGCRAEKRDAWATRITCEAKMHKTNIFLTLTYDNEHLPPDHSLTHAHWQQFAKNLRKRLGPFRFFMVGEYGDRTSRPHYHAIMFGVDPPDAVRVNSVRSKHQLYNSAPITSAWGKGKADFGYFTPAAAKYVCDYTIKKLNGDRAIEAYRYLDPSTGEVFDRSPEYARMSLRPGIGRPFLEKYAPEILANNAVYEGSRPNKIPAFFDKHLETLSPDEFAESKLKRYNEAQKRLSDNTRARLEVREEIAIRKYQRSKETQNHDL